MLPHTRTAQRPWRSSGSSIRDLLAGRVPEVLRREPSAAPTLFGSVLLDLDAPTALRTRTGTP